MNLLMTPYPTFPQGGRRKINLFPLGGNKKGGILVYHTIKI
jgi:hypothetical protein